MREQMTPAKPGQLLKPTNSAALKDDGAKIDTMIKKTIAANMKKPKQMQKAALETLGKQVASNPGTTPKDLKKIADVISDEGM
jgi:hypothetical protein